MKQILSILLVMSIIACGGGEKKTQEITPTPPPGYVYQIPTQDMLDNGKIIFNTSCFLCHEDGAGEVTMISDNDYWTDNRTKDIETLVQHVNDGYTGDYGTMTRKGSCIDCSKDDLRDAIYYMMAEAGVIE